MQDSTFGDISFERSEEKWSKIDREPYRRVIRALQEQPEDHEARFTVMTGEIIPEGKPGAGRGKLELADDRGFRVAAHEVGKSVRVGWKHVEGGRTQMRLQLQNKREYSDKTVKNRELGLSRKLLRDAEAKLARLKAQAQVKPDDAELKAEVADVAAKVKKHSEKVASLDGSAKAPAKQ